MKNALSLFAFLLLFLAFACNDEDPIQPMPEPEPEPELASLANGQVFHAPFAGNADDVAGNLSGTVNGATATSDRHGVANEAYEFDGFDDVIDYGEGDILVMPNQDPYTISAWVKMEDRGDGEVNMIMAKFNKDVNAGWFLGVSSTGKLRSYRHNVPWSLNSNSSITYGEYVHVAAAYDGTELSVYLNGQLDRSIPFGRNNNDRSTGVLVGGMYDNGNVNPLLRGVVDEIRIHNRVLTQEELTWLAEH
ncbi:MAG: LamG domain-containing protein [Bacteroidota bacterium]